MYAVTKKFDGSCDMLDVHVNDMIGYYTTLTDYDDDQTILY